MNCPSCGKPLHPMEVGSLALDVCDGGCGGIWFDNHELQKVDEPHEAAGEKLLELPRQDVPEVDASRARQCPKCSGQNLFRHFYSVKRQVEVDDCPRCGGVWLDVGELAAIRNQYQTEDERKHAAEECFEDVFGDRLSEMRDESEEGLQRARRIARIFRFVCPSYYIPGKQDWGAY